MQDVESTVQDVESTVQDIESTVQDVESTVPDVETKGNPVNLSAFSYWIFFIGTLIWNNMNSY